MLKTLIDIIFPPKCLNCKKIITSNGNLCSDCWKNINFITKPYCNICGINFVQYIADDTTCTECITNPPYFNQARSLFLYDLYSKKIIINFKYYDQTLNGKYIAKWLFNNLDEMLKDIDYIIPIPMNKFNLFVRKYNQTIILANYLSKFSNIPTINDGLIRIKTSTQVGIDKKQRLKNIKNCFIINKKFLTLLKGKNITLIDDVMTTKATINECSRILLQNNVKKINVITIARTP